MSRGINFQKIVDSRRTRDWQNIPLGKIDRVVHGMPPPPGLDPQEKKVLISFYLNESTIRFYKKEANRYGTKYQRLLRAILERYKHAHV